MKYHHGTIRNYTASLLNLFNSTEIQYNLSNGDTKTSRVPLSYSSREKSTLLDELSESQVVSGNTNMLPLGYLRFDGLDRNLDRNTNKNLKINSVKSDLEIEYMSNSVPCNFEFELSYICRGINEATQIIEQIVTLFNPNYHIDVYDVANLTKPSRIPIKLNNVGFQHEDYDSLSSNIVAVVFSITVVGNLYMPIQKTARFKELNITLNEIINENDALRVSMMEWDAGDQNTD